MIVAVSATASVKESDTGEPTRTVTIGGCRIRVISGIRADRGQTFSVPHNPIGTTTAPVDAASRAVPVFPLNAGSKKSAPARDRALGQHDDDLAGAQGRFGRAQRLVRSPAPVHRDATDGPCHEAHHGCVENLLFAQETNGTPHPGGNEGECRHVEVTPMVGGQQDRPFRRDVLESRDVEARVGERRRPDERPQQVIRLEPDHTRHARRPVPMLNGPTACGGDDGQRRVRVDGVRESHAGEQRHVEHAVAAGMAVVGIDGLLLAPRPHGFELAGPPDEPVVEAPGVAPLLRLVGRGDDRVETHRFGERRDHINRGGRGQHEHVTFGPERIEVLGGEGGHQLRQVGYRPPARCLHLALIPSLGHPGRRPDEAHGEEVLTEAVVDGIEEPVPRQ